MRNYFEEGKKISKSEKFLSEDDRSFGIQKIFDLHIKKDYKVETIFIAAGIFDRYINTLGLENFPRAQVLHLSVICVLMSAKLE